jgi:hypothetical protein
MSYLTQILLFNEEDINFYAKTQNTAGQVRKEREGLKVELGDFTNLRVL